MGSTIGVGEAADDGDGFGGVADGEAQDAVAALPG
jgi:hypothetical protein